MKGLSIEEIKEYVPKDSKIFGAIE
jgi:hypothetical protein